MLTATVAMALVLAVPGYRLETETEKRPSASLFGRHKPPPYARWVVDADDLITTKDGRVYIGRILAVTDKGFEIRLPSGEAVTIDIKDVADVESTPRAQPVAEPQPLPQALRPEPQESRPPPRTRMDGIDRRAELTLRLREWEWARDQTDYTGATFAFASMFMSGNILGAWLAVGPGFLGPEIYLICVAFYATVWVVSLVVAITQLVSVGHAHGVVDAKIAALREDLARLR